MKTSLPVVKLSVLRPFIDGLKALSVDPDVLAENAGLSVAAIFQDDAVAHVMLIHQFLEDCAAATGNVFFCAEIGAKLDQSGWPPIGRAKQHARTLGDFMTIFVSGTPDLAASSDVFLEIRGKQAIFGQRRRFPPTIVPAQNDGFSAALGISMIRHCIGDRLDPRQTLVVVSDPSAVPFLSEGFQVIGGDRNGIRIQFPSEWLAFVIGEDTGSGVAPPGEVAGIDTDLMSSFRALLLQNIGDGGLDAARAARLVHMSKSKLSRFLASQGSSISAEIMDAKLVFARGKLRDSALEIEEIATRLGYADPSNFSRAFSRHVGMAPSRYRRENTGAR
ncbi:MAG: helix-turn-helix domain-containing protein [Pseudomonadota bacterium]